MSDTNNSGGLGGGVSLQIIVNTLQNLVIAFNGLINTLNNSVTTIWTSIWTAVWSILAEQTVTYAATVTLDMSKGFNFGTTLTGNILFANPINTHSGQKGYIAITQGGGGGFTATFGTAWFFAGGTGPALTAAAGSIDVLDYEVRSATVIFTKATLNEKHT